MKIIRKEAGDPMPKEWLGKSFFTETRMGIEYEHPPPEPAKTVILIREDAREINGGYSDTGTAYFYK